MNVLRELQPSDASDSSFSIPQMETGKAGRPPYAILPEQLKYLLDLGFKVTKIATLLGVHRSTIHDRLK